MKYKAVVKIIRSTDLLIWKCSHNTHIAVILFYLKLFYSQQSGFRVNIPHLYVTNP